METQQLNSRESLDLDVGNYLQFLKQRWLLLLFIWLGSVGVAAVFALTKAPTFEASTKLLVKVDRTSDLTGVGAGVGDFDPLVNAQNPLSTEVEIITSSPFLERVIGTLGLTDDEGEALDPRDLAQGLSVNIVGGADVLNLSYQSEDPEVAANVANELARVYIESNILNNQLQASKARVSLEQQLPESEEFVRQSEASLRQFKEQNRIISLPDEARSVVEVLQDLDTQILSTQASLEEVSTQVAQLQSNLGLEASQALAAVSFSQSEAIQGVLQELNAVERQKAANQGIYTDQSPVIQVDQAQEESLRRLLGREVAVLAGGNANVPESLLSLGEMKQTMVAQFLDAEVQRLGLANRLRALSESRQAYLSRASSLPLLEQKQSELERRQEVARLSYTNTLQRLRDLQVAETQSIANATIIEPAILPDEPSGTSKKVILAMGGLIGLFLAAGTAAILRIFEGADSDHDAKREFYLPSPEGSPEAAIFPEQSTLNALDLQAQGKKNTM